MSKDLLDIRGRWENWKIGGNAADAPMPDCQAAPDLPMPESPIHAVKTSMPKSGIKPININFAELAENSGCVNIFGWFFKSKS